MGAHTHTVSGTAATSGLHTHKFERGTSVGSNNALCRSNYTTDETDYGQYSSGAHTHTVSGTAASGGTHTHTITVASNGAHTHTVSGTAASAGGHSHTITNASTTATNKETGGSSSFSIMNPYVILNYIIKY